MNFYGILANITVWFLVAYSLVLNSDTRLQIPVYFGISSVVGAGGGQRKTYFKRFIRNEKVNSTD